MSTDPAAERVQSVPSVAGFRQIVDVLPAFVWCAAPDGSIAFLNRRGLDYTGFQLADVTGWSWKDTSILHPDDVHLLFDAWQAIVDSGREGEVQARMRRFDGEYRWFLFRVAPLYDDGGRLLAWWGVDVEIDERKRAEALLAAEKHLLEMMAKGNALPLILEALCVLVEEVAPRCSCAVLLVDATRTCLHHGAAPSLPASYNEAIHGRPIHPEAGPCGMAAFLKEQVVTADITSDARWHAEWRGLAVDHGLRACWSTPIVSSAGAVVGTFAVYWRQPGGPTAEHQNVIERMTHLAAVAIERAHDATARKRADDVRRRSEANLARAQRLSATGSFSYAAATEVLILSEETRRICGFEAGAEVTPAVMRDRIHPEDLPQFLEMLGSAGRAFRFDCRVRLPDMSIRYLQVIADAVRDDRDHLVEWVGAIRDVTDTKRAEDALNEVRSDLAHVARVATLGEMTASIAHEINQPLGAIVNNASAGLRWLAANNVDQARASAELVVADGHRASEILARIRAMARKSPPQTQWVDVNDAVREVITLAGSQAEKHGVSIEVCLSAAVPSVRADRVQIQQVVLNLLINAVEAMSGTADGGRRVAVTSTVVDDTTVHVSVRDQGTGIDPAELDRLCAAFYSTKPDGLGMGLAISRAIVEAHHGRLWATANPDRGATFHVALTIAGEDGA
jgi:PAS domain S-box-containing protein